MASSNRTDLPTFIASPQADSVFKAFGITPNVQPLGDNSALVRGKPSNLLGLHPKGTNEVQLNPYTLNYTPPFAGNILNPTRTLAHETAHVLFGSEEIGNQFKQIMTNAVNKISLKDIEDITDMNTNIINKEMFVSNLIKTPLLEQGGNEVFNHLVSEYFAEVSERAFEMMRRFDDPKMYEFSLKFLEEEYPGIVEVGQALHSKLNTK